jgi:hypothetical protein
MGEPGTWAIGANRHANVVYLARRRVVAPVPGSLVALIDGASRRSKRSTQSRRLNLFRRMIGFPAVRVGMGAYPVHPRPDQRRATRIPSYRTLNSTLANSLPELELQCRHQKAGNEQEVIVPVRKP